jgi:hypothetical protein
MWSLNNIYSSQEQPTASITSTQREVVSGYWRVKVDRNVEWMGALWWYAFPPLLLVYVID